VIVAVSTDETLLILKIAFLVLLYGFIVLVVRSATKDIGGAPQDAGKQFDERGTPNRCTLVKPGAVAGDGEVDLDGPGRRGRFTLP